MLFDDHKRFVGICIDNLLWGNLKLDFTEAEKDDELAKKIARLSGNMSKWIVYREKPESEEFKLLTVDGYFDLIGARFSNTLQGELRDKDLDEENRKLKEDNIRYRIQNEELRKDNTILASELKDKNDLVEQYEQATGVRKP